MLPTRRLVLTVLFACALVVSSAAVGLAQSNAADAAIDGYVRDGNGGVLPGATVSARNARTVQFGARVTF